MWSLFNYLWLFMSYCYINMFITFIWDHNLTVLLQRHQHFKAKTNIKTTHIERVNVLNIHQYDLKYQKPASNLMNTLKYSEMLIWQLALESYLAITWQKCVYNNLAKCVYYISYLTITWQKYVYNNLAICVIISECPDIWTMYYNFRLF